ncbi:MAG: hypothetical protein AAGA25_15300, partial [Planctomycetota bacterium]
MCALVLGCANNKPQTPRAPDIVRTAPTPVVVESPPENEDTQTDEQLAPPVEAMVGQIAGQPIYAHHVLAGMEEQLASLGRRLPRQAFREQATALIFEQVRGLVQDALIQDEADRTLSP